MKDNTALQEMLAITGTTDCEIPTVTGKNLADRMRFHVLISAGVLLVVLVLVPYFESFIEYDADALFDDHDS